MTDKELQIFTINYINKKVEENENYIRYTFFELKVKNELSETELKEFLEINRNYFENNNYRVYVTGEEFWYNNKIRKVEINEIMIAVK